MIKMGGKLDGIHMLVDYAGTVGEAIKKDYLLWKARKFVAELTYKGQLLNRLNDDCEFDDEIEHLKEQMKKIDDNERKEV